jgi:manganese/zinc/iron transport system permease protein
MNPYWGSGFFEFFKILFFRLFTANPTLASDEVQLATLAVVSISCGLLGPFLVLKRMAMFTNSLSHTILFGIVLAFILASKLWGSELFSLTTLLIGSFAAACLTAALTEGLNRFFRLSEDASVGLVFSSLFALGILLVTLFTRDVHLGLEAIMGNVDALQTSDLEFASLLALLNAAVLFLFYRQFKSSAFDSEHASILGTPTAFFRFLLLLLSSFICVGAFRAVGVLLVLGLLTGPYLTARLFCHRLKHLLWLSPALGIFASAVGVALSRALLSAYDLPLSTAGIVICVIGAFYLVGVNLSTVINSWHEKKNLPSR